MTKSGLFVLVMGLVLGEASALADGCKLSVFIDRDNEKFLVKREAEISALLADVKGFELITHAGQGSPDFDLAITTDHVNNWSPFLDDVMVYVRNSKGEPAYVARARPSQFFRRLNESQAMKLLRRMPTCEQLKAQ